MTVIPPVEECMFPQLVSSMTPVVEFAAMGICVAWIIGFLIRP